MIFRVLSNRTFCRGENKEKIFLLKKEKSIITYFDWRSGIKFLNSTVEMKYVPKKHPGRESLLSDKKIFSLKNSDGFDLIIQAIEGSPSLLKIDDDGIIFPEKIENIKEDDSIITYQEQESKHDWIVSDMLMNEQLFFENEEKKSFLSNYLFRLEVGSGIILNDYFIC
jgi:hypothetical protein